MKTVERGGLIATTARTLEPFTLYQPNSVAEVIDILERSSPPPVLLAGGTDLSAQINAGLRPASVVELRKVEELQRVECTGGELLIGSGVSHDTGGGDPMIRRLIPGFSEAWGRIATVRIRGRATIGGNLMARRTRYEMSVILTALRARLHFADGNGARTYSPEAIWSDPAAARGLMTHVSIDAGNHVAFAYDRSMRPIVTLAVSLRRTPDGLEGHAAIATEWLRPVLLALPPVADVEQLSQHAGSVAAAAFMALPDNFYDPMSGRAYLAQVGQVLLTRRLKEFSHA
jgi:carbon-monoxide dehydrogenase medium subunit